MEREREWLSFPAKETARDKRKWCAEEADTSSVNDQSVRTKRPTPVPPFGVERAEQARQHVVALNTQFTSWVQKQLEEHPDELWSDGVQDYIKHASEIMVTFHDVVQWLLNNATANAQAVSANTSDAGFVDDRKQALERNSCQVISVPDKNNKRNLGIGELPESGSVGLQASIQNTVVPGKENQVFSGFGAPQSSVSFGLQSSNQNSSVPSKDNQGKSGFVLPPGSVNFGLQFGNPNLSVPSKDSGGNSGFGVLQEMSFGIQSSNPSLFSAGVTSSSTLPSIKTEKSVNNEDDDGEVAEPPSPSVKRIEEPGIIIVHEAKCKLYVQNPAEKGWKDKGKGQLYIKCKEDAKKGTKEAKARVEIRNDVGKLLLNALLYPNMKLTINKTTVATIFYTTDEQAAGGDAATPRMYLIRVASEEDTKMLENAICENMPSAN